MKKNSLQRKKERIAHEQKIVKERAQKKVLVHRGVSDESKKKKILEAKKQRRHPRKVVEKYVKGIMKRKAERKEV